MNINPEELKGLSDEKAKEMIGESIKGLQSKIKEMESKQANWADTSEGKSYTQKITDQIAAITTKADETKKAQEDQLNELKAIREELVKQVRPGGVVDAKKATYDDFNKALRYAGLKVMQFKNREADPSKIQLPDAYKALTTTDFGSGGALVLPTEIAKEIIDIDKREMNVVRQHATIKTGEAESWQTPLKTAHGSAGWTREQGTRTEDESLKYGSKKIYAHESYVYYAFTHQMGHSTGFDLLGELQNEYREAGDALHEAGYINGNGIIQPLGVMNCPDIGYTPTGVAGGITSPDCLIDLKQSIKKQYRERGRWLMAKETVAYFAKLKYGDGHYMAGSFVMSILPDYTISLMGRPVDESENMPAVASGINAVVYADWKNYYIYDQAIGRITIIDPYSAKATGTIEVMMYTNTGGDVVDPSGFKFLKFSVS